MIDDGWRDWTAAHKQAALEVPLEAVAREVGASHKGDVAVDDEQLGVHRRPRRSYESGPGEASGADPGERIAVAVELGVVDLPLEQGRDLNAAIGRSQRGLRGSRRSASVA